MTRIVSAQAVVKGMNLLGPIPPHHLFLGMQDLTPVLANRQTGLFGTLQMLRETPGYLGSWPKAGYLDSLPLGQFLSPPLLTLIGSFGLSFLASVAVVGALCAAAALVLFLTHLKAT